MNPAAIFLIIPLLTIAFAAGFAFGRHRPAPRRRCIGYHMEQAPGGFTIMKPIFEDEEM